MALQPTNIPVSFSKGLNTKNDPKQTMPGSLLTLANGVFTKVNAINQDPGYLPIPQTIYNSTNTVIQGNSLNTFNSQLVLSDSQFLYSFSETTQSWAQFPTKIATSIAAQSIETGAISNTPIGIAKNTAGLEFYTYGVINSTDLGITPGQESIMGINSVIYDPISETTLYSNYFADASSSSSGTPIQFYGVTFGTNFTSLYVITPALGGATTLSYRTFSSINPPQTASPTILLGSVGVVDMVQSATNLYVVAGSTLYQYDTTFTLVNSVVVPGSSGYISITRDPLTGNLYLLGDDGTNVTMAIYSSSLAVVKAAAPIFVPTSTVTALTGVLVNPTTYFVYVQVTSTTTFNTPGYFDTNVYSVNTTTLASSMVELLVGCYIATKAYIFNSQATIGLGFFDYTTPQSSPIALLDQSVYVTIQQAIPNSNYTLNTNYTQIAKYAEGTAGAPLAVGQTPARPNQVLSISNTFTIIPYLSAINDNIDSNVTINIYNIERLSTVFGTHTRSTVLANNYNSTGGILTIFDGAGIAEAGFTIFPWQTTATFSSSLVIGTPPPSLTAGDTYSYVVTYEWLDIEGNLHRSSPGPASTGVAATSDSSHRSQAVINVNGTSLSEQYKVNNISVVLWRTTGNGSIFYRIASKPNDTVITFTDSTPDTNIQDSTQLYTTGGEVDNIAPPATDILFPYKNRLIAVEADNPYVWWYSKQVIQGFPAEFSDLFTSNIDMTGGPISAGQTMDDKLIFFKNSAIFYVIGDGPAPNGTANDFSYPQVITSDVGCTNQDSIIVIPNGLLFQSTDKGIYLLDRNLQVSYLGAAVEQFNNIPVTSAVLLPNTTQVRFTLNNGTILIYDYAAQQWSTHTTLVFNDSTIYKSMHTGLQPNGQVLEQTQGQFIDITTPNPLSLTTGWFEFANLQGYQRVLELLLLLTSQNATSILVQVYMDFDTTTAINNDLIVIPANTMRQQYRIFPAFQKGQAMQIKITEIPTGSQAGGLLLSGLAFTAGIKRGLNKISGDRNYG